MYMYTFTYLLEITRSKSGPERKQQRLPSGRVTMPASNPFEAHKKTTPENGRVFSGRTIPTHTLRHSDPACRSRTSRFVRDNYNFSYHDVCALLCSLLLIYTYMKLYRVTAIQQEIPVVSTLTSFYRTSIWEALFSIYNKYKQNAAECLEVSCRSDYISEKFPRRLQTGYPISTVVQRSSPQHFPEFLTLYTYHFYNNLNLRHYAITRETYFIEHMYLLQSRQHSSISTLLLENYHSQLLCLTFYEESSHRRLHCLLPVSQEGSTARIQFSILSKFILLSIHSKTYCLQ